MMKKIGNTFILLLLSFFLFSSQSPVDAQDSAEQEDEQESGVIVFAKLLDTADMPGDDPWSSQWDQATPVIFPLSGQVHWEPRQLRPSVTSLTVRSLHDGDKLFVMLEYKDPQQDEGDGAAAEFMVGDKKAHFAHGQKMIQVEGGPVNIWFWRGGKTQDMSAKGFGTLKAQSQQDVQGNAAWKNGVWRVSFSRSLQTGDARDVQMVPGEFRQIAFAIWDAAQREEGARKAVSSWWYFRLEPEPDQGIWVYTLLAVFGALIFEMVLVRKLKNRPKNV